MAFCVWVLLPDRCTDCLAHLLLSALFADAAIGRSGNRISAQQCLSIPTYNGVTNRGYIRHRWKGGKKRPLYPQEKSAAPILIPVPVPKRGRGFLHTPHRYPRLSWSLGAARAVCS